MEEAKDYAPAWKILELMELTWEWYFPPEMRTRFEEQADKFETLPLLEWENRFQSKKESLKNALAELHQWSDETDTSLVMLAWEHEVLFWYVMRMQAWCLMLASKPDAMVPWDAEEIWERYIMHVTTWMEFVFGAAGAFLKIETPPKIWRIAWPSDQAGPPHRLTGDPVR